jgi:hypothetical protein
VIQSLWATTDTDVCIAAGDSLELNAGKFVIESPPDSASTSVEYYGTAPGDLWSIEWATTDIDEGFRIPGEPEPVRRFIFDHSVTLPGFIP